MKHSKVLGKLRNRYENLKSKFLKYADEHPMIFGLLFLTVVSWIGWFGGYLIVSLLLKIPFVKKVIEPYDGVHKKIIKK